MKKGVSFVFTFLLMFLWFGASVKANTPIIPMTIAQQANKQSQYHSQNLQRWNQKVLKAQSKILQSSYKNQTNIVNIHKKKRQQYEKNKSHILKKWMLGLKKTLHKTKASEVKNRLAQYIAAYRSGKIRAKNIDEFAYCLKREIYDFTRGKNPRTQCTRVL